MPTNCQQHLRAIVERRIVGWLSKRAGVDVHAAQVLRIAVSILFRAVLPARRDALHRHGIL